MPFNIGGQIYNTTHADLNDYKNIITTGLVLHLDASALESYPGTGDYWYNMGTNGGSISKGTYLPSYTTLSGVTCFNFNQTGAFFENTSFFTTPFPAGGTNLTIDVWINPAASELTAGDRGNIVRATNGNAWYMSWNKDNRKLSNYWYGKTNEGYHESTAAITRGTWNNLVSSWSSSGLSQYINNTKTTAVTSGTGGSTTSGITIGYEGDGRQFAGGIASIKIYNRALSDNEVTQNYNIQKARFGI
jgi:hypothetical protein